MYSLSASSLGATNQLRMVLHGSDPVLPDLFVTSLTYDMVTHPHRKVSLLNEGGGKCQVSVR